MTPTDDTPHRCSCHAKDTTNGDTFGGMGTSEEVREEELARHEDPCDPSRTEPDHGHTA